MNTTPEQKEQIVSLTLKSILNSFPVVGPILTDIFFEYRSKVKQERLNHFVGLLEDEFSKLDIDSKTLKTEENLDLFEGIFKKVAESRSERKRVAFKNILIHGFQNKEEIEYCEIFSDLLLSIKSQQLEILIEHKKYLVNGIGVLAERNELKNELYKLEEKLRMGIPEMNFPQPSFSFILTPRKRTKEELENVIKSTDKLLGEYQINCTAEKFEISQDEYKYFLQDLFSKGLLSDDGVGTHGVGQFEIMSLTNFGVKFLYFVED